MSSSPSAALLTLTSVCAATPDRRPLFSGLTLSIGRERVGLVGRNGCGKSTLLRIVAGTAEAASGSVTLSGATGTLVQEWRADESVAEALGIERAMAAIARVLAGEGRANDFELADWSIEPCVAAALAEVGLAGLPLDRAMGTLSGGERTRVGLARLAVEAPDLLLLDEPTNNLDAAGRAAVHALVANWRGGVLVASHDRALLEGMDRIVELSPIGIAVVGGGWSAFAEARDARRADAAGELERAAAGLREAKDAAQRRREARERRDAAGRAFAARGSEPRLLLGAQAERAENTGARGGRVDRRLMDAASARAEEARSKVEIATPLKIVLPPSGLPSGTELLTMEAVTVAVEERVLGPWTLHIRGPERVAVSGANGVGKTSLLKVATGIVSPAGGTLRRAEGRIAMLDQHVGLLDSATSILANVRRLNPALDSEAAHAACARFAFRNRDALRPVGVLSGGERLRAGLACALAGDRPPWLLVLDEPTNHLDLDSVEVLEAALKAFDGALLVVSHDPAFLEAISIERTIRLGG
ncbi:ATPase components of ABC transporters with duplicated ATPase domains [Pseudoxanthobacter soli DSM 19599]|uniref:ATPase components of ABC transporters with duplicated ATPase domains n=1 Tax=Pseudoxanthobacter soli DSM 19599 TaxID=1123029 RepID=A0A1M7Z9E7_9HYPH|nr:ATP-binding cassette domain-containing protein [Pseudoxanthobacter soli]SHO61567.1 ATPase components of ABC transporters with duplicated ATPase domains [Pseudoxanthobacter soli DSM 19599]